MINVATIMEQIRQWLEDDVNLATFTVTRSDFANEDPGAAVNGWIGVYRRSVDYDPRNLGQPPNNYEGSLIFDVLVQKTSMESGASAEDSLEEAVKDVLDRLVQIPKTYLDHFSDILVEYAYIETDRTTLYFQGALITVTAEFSIEVK